VNALKNLPRRKSPSVRSVERLLCRSGGTLAVYGFPGQLAGNFVGVTHGEGTDFDLVFGAVLARFAVRQAGEGKRQREEIQKFAVTTLLFGGVGVGTAHDNSLPIMKGMGHPDEKTIDPVVLSFSPALVKV
jgi:hypothetical protein